MIISRSRCEGKVIAEASKLSNVEYYWSWGDKKTDTGRVADHVYKSDGKFTICLTVFDKKTNCKKTVCSTVYLRQKREGAGAGEDDALYLFPNPAVENLSVVTNTTSPARISIKDTRGNELIRYDATPDDNKTINLYIESLPKGIYLMFIEQDGQTSTTKFMK